METKKFIDGIETKICLEDWRKYGKGNKNYSFDK